MHLFVRTNQHDGNNKENKAQVRKQPEFSFKAEFQTQYKTHELGSVTTSLLKVSALTLALAMW